MARAAAGGSIPLLPASAMLANSPPQAPASDQLRWGGGDAGRRLVIGWVVTGRPGNKHTGKSGNLVSDDAAAYRHKKSKNF